MELYYIGLQQVETETKRQFDENREQRRLDRPETRQQRVTVSARARLAIGGALYRLAEAIDPVVPAPSRQH
jgi:hypothetical protein